MGPDANGGTGKNKGLITAVAVVVVIALIVTATVFANKKDESTDVAADTSATTTTNTGSSSTDSSSSSASDSSSSTSSYKDGTYTAKGSYQSPGGSQGISVTVTIANGVVTDSSVTSNSSDRESKEYQDMFVEGYKKYVTGKSVDSIKLSRVSGSSLTSQGFNNALDTIKDQAKA